MGEIIDISRVVSEETAVWPGDTTNSRTWVMSMADCCSCNNLAALASRYLFASAIY